ncbi:MAG: isochorismate synthase [Acidimicrobiia bacterium]|nr:isochorismate synthase [Acidimicrobiia bacterium]
MLLSPWALAAARSQLTAADTAIRFASVPVDATPISVVRAAAPVFGTARFLRTPRGRVMAGLGTAVRFTATGPDRFAALGRQLAATDLHPDAIVFVGFSFAADGPQGPEWEGFAAAEAVVPTATVVADGTGTRLVVAIPPGSHPSGFVATLRDLAHPGSVRLAGFGDHVVRAVPPGTDWCRAVDEAVGAIAEGALVKVVLARSAVVATEMTIDPFEMVHHLVERHPDTYCFGWQIGGTAFVGASPELLVGRHGHRVTSHPLAGSAPRGEGDEADRSAGAALLASGKDRQEHAVVVGDIADRLGRVTTQLEVAAAPSLVVGGTVQHLSTRITGTLAPGVSLLDLVGRLHPTPAVGGMPRVEAMGFIDKLEVIDRGWYSGGVGWMNPAGDGDIAIALRCGLISGTEARLYAGNGIVAGSDPETELVETRWKLRPLLDLLTAT